MLIIRLFQLLVAALLAFAVVTQVIVPAITGRILFPFFRDESRRALWDLFRTRERKHVAKVRKEAAEEAAEVAEVEADVIREEVKASGTLDDLISDLENEDVKRRIE